MRDVATIDGSDFRRAFKKSPNPCMLLSRDLVILACNEAYEHTSGISRERMLHQDLFKVFPGDNHDQRKLLLASFDHVLRSGQPHHIPIMEYSINIPNKGVMEDRYWTVSNVPLVEDDGTVNIIFHCPRDVTELVRLRGTADPLPGVGMPSSAVAEAATQWTRDVQDILGAERERLRLLFQQAPGFICVLQGPNHVFELANDSYYQLVGHRDVLGRPVVEALPEVISQGYPEKLDQVFTTGEPFVGRALPVRLQRTPDGGLELRYIDMIYQPIRDHAGRVTGIFVQGHDVTDAYLLAQEIAYQAAHDALTGLYNRRELTRQTQAIGTGDLHALLYIDIDHFKIVNDRCGHAAGDALLRQIAGVLQAQAAESDLLTRLGGDEFALLRRNCSREDAQRLANALCHAVREIGLCG